jgi:hypothetical protein
MTNVSKECKNPKQDPRAQSTLRNKWIHKLKSPQKEREAGTRRKDCEFMDNLFNNVIFVLLEPALLMLPLNPASHSTLLMFSEQNPRHGISNVFKVVGSRRRV